MLDDPTEGCTKDNCSDCKWHGSCHTEAMKQVDPGLVVVNGHDCYRHFPVEDY